MLRAVSYYLLTDPLAVRHVPDWFPGTEFKALAKEAREKYRISIEGPLKYVKNTMKVGPRASPGVGCA
jgi:hypothetical protein